MEHTRGTAAKECKNTQMPKGIPDHIFHFQELHGAEQCG